MRNVWERPSLRGQMAPSPYAQSARDRYNEQLHVPSGWHEQVGPEREDMPGMEDMNWWEKMQGTMGPMGGALSGLGGLLGYTGPQDYTLPQDNWTGNRWNQPEPKFNIPQVENDMYENPEWFGGSSGSNVYSEPNFRRPPEGY